VGVEVAAESQLRAAVPTVPDGLHGTHELAHPCGRLRPLHREALGDVRSDLSAEPHDEAAVAVALQVVANLGEDHGVTGEGHGDRCTQLEALGVLGGDDVRQKGVMTRLGGPGTGIALVLEALRRRTYGGESAGQGSGIRGAEPAVDLHAPTVAVG